LIEGGKKKKTTSSGCRKELASKISNKGEKNLGVGEAHDREEEKKKGKKNCRRPLAKKRRRVALAALFSKENLDAYFIKPMQRRKINRGCQIARGEKDARVGCTLHEGRAA